LLSFGFAGQVEIWYLDYNLLFVQEPTDPSSGNTCWACSQIILPIPAFDIEFRKAVEDVDNLFGAKLLTYPVSTWKFHASGIKGLMFIQRVRAVFRTP
jgi:hypothetical protein